MHILCLDAEFADNEELLELSVFDLEGKEVYHDYYKPSGITRWRTDIHRITPEMVRDKKNFAASRRKVEDLLHCADAITGFAVDNDLRVLDRSGVRDMERLRVIDVKDMYWYLKGRAEDMSPFGVPSLIACANALGIGFGEEEAHSASADTLATLKCFGILLGEYAGPATPGIETVDNLIKEMEAAKADFVKASASGYVKVFRAPEGHKLKFSHEPEGENRYLEFEVPVNDRYKAEYELRKDLKKREVPGRIYIYKFKGNDLDRIRKYTNEYDAEDSAWCKKVVRNLSRLEL